MFEGEWNRGVPFGQGTLRFFGYKIDLIGKTDNYYDRKYGLCEDHQFYNVSYNAEGVLKKENVNSDIAFYENSKKMKVTNVPKTFEVVK